MLPKYATIVLTLAIAALLATSTLAADGMVSGTITLDGAPLPAGKISFHRKDGQFVGARIKEGKFSVDHLPPGQHAVVIQGKGVPDKYGSETVTPLVVDVKEGGASFDFDLKT